MVFFYMGFGSLVIIMIIIFVGFTGMDMNEKIEIFKSEFQDLLKKGQDWVQHLSVEINEQEWTQKLPPFLNKNQWMVQNVPPLQLYVALLVLFLTMLFFFIGNPLLFFIDLLAFKHYGIFR